LAPVAKAWPVDSRPLAEVRLPQLQRVSPEVVRAQVRSQVGQQPDAARQEADVRRLYATGDFERVGYGLFDDAGRRVLSFDAVEKSWAPNSCQFGLEEGADLRGESRFELAGCVPAHLDHSLGGEWRTDLRLGTKIICSTELYQPLDVASFSLSRLTGSWIGPIIDVFCRRAAGASYVLHEGRAGLDLGARLGGAGSCESAY